MPTFRILAWQPLLRPPLPADEPPDLPESPVKALSCRNQFVTLAALVTSSEPVPRASVEFTDLISGGSVLPAKNLRVRVVGVVPTPEAGPVCDPLFEVEELSIERSAALSITAWVGQDTAAGIYTGTMRLIVDGEPVAANEVEIEVADVVLPDSRDWSFFLSVWMNPASVARWHGVEVWSDHHFDLLEPYLADLAAHGQKSVVAPICYQPWGTQTRDPFPSTVRWARWAGQYEFDFSVFDRYVRLHEKYGIDTTIHCYSIVQGPGATSASTIVYTDADDAGDEVVIKTAVGEPEWEYAWGQFFVAFRKHLIENDWLEKTFIAFDEKPDAIMDAMLDFVARHAPDFRIALAGNTSDELTEKLDDLCLHVKFDERGIADPAPAVRSAVGVAELLRPDACSLQGRCPEKSLTTFYVCCGPPFPNTFLMSPLVESRMLPFLAIQGGYDGFLRWSYNDWSDNPYEHPEWNENRWATGDTFFVYPGEHGPVSSLRWEQLREGIYDYELALIASGNIEDPEEMIDFEQAIALACRNPNGAEKSIGDIEIARRLLIPMARRQGASALTAE